MVRLAARRGKPRAVRFVRGLIAFRKRYPLLRTDTFYTEKDLEWFGPSGRPPDWDGPTRALGCLVQPQMRDGANSAALCLLFNAGETPAEFHLAAAPAAPWRVSIDTANPAPHDVFWFGSEPRAPDPGRYRVGSRAFAVLSSA